MKKRQLGYSYIEVLVAAILLATVMVPASNALRGIMAASEIHRDRLQLQYVALARFETTMAQPFAMLETEAAATAGTTPSIYSDPASTPNRVIVYVSPLDMDGIAGDDPGAVQVRVEVEGTEIAFEQITVSAT